MKKNMCEHKRGVCGREKDMDKNRNPLWDNQLPIEERLDYLIQELTLEEKLGCLTTGCPNIERLGIKATYMGGEAAHGIEARHDQAFNAGEPEYTTSLTQPIGMSGSFDRELIKECGRVVGEEARALFTRNGGGGLCRWAPTIDMERDPRWGRTEEAYGEDPYLTGEMASAYIQGMKGEHPFYLQCGATLKHFYANNVEKDRIKISSSLDMRNKYEYYLEPFRKAIMEGGAEAIMTSYNEINGIPAIVNDEVQKLLKDTYGLPGHVVCDGGDFQQTVKDHKYYETHAETLAYGLKAGVDCFTDDGEVVRAAAREALKKGLITEADINRSIRNSFRTRIRLGWFDEDGDCPYSDMGEEYINNEEHKAITAKMAEESVVLLKNENHMLPFLPEKTESLAVVGVMADVWYKDWYCGIPPYQVTVLDGMKKAYPNAEITYDSGLSEIRLTCDGKYVGLDQDDRLYLTDESHAETFIFTDWGCGNTTLVSKSNGKFVTLEEGTYLIKADKKEAFSWFIREAFKFRNCETDSMDVKPDETDALYYIDSWNDRQIAVNEDGYLVVIKTGETHVGEGDDDKLNCKCYAVSEGEPSRFGIEVVRDGVAEAVELAKKAQKVVIVLGSNPVINSKEEIDRTTLALPPAQQRFADAIYEGNPNAIVVLVTNYPYSINALQETMPGILYAPSGSQEMGTGIAAVISGRTSPAARLAMTWYRSDDDLPDMSDYDIIQGNRTYQYFAGEVLYPFGHGFSYSEFQYHPMTIEPDGEGVRIKLIVENVGKVTADEVVQLYVHKETSRVKQPRKQLRGFERVKQLKPGECREVMFHVRLDELRYYDVISQEMRLESSVYTFMVGASSEDIRQQISIELRGDSIASRDAYIKTEAVLFDRSHNCFVHKGMDNGTCMIPGKPGDDPNAIDMACTEKISGRLEYDDLAFRQKPVRFMMHVRALESGEIRILCKEKTRIAWDIIVEIDQNEEFEKIMIKIPENSVDFNKKYTLSLEIHGKIKVVDYEFR